MSRLVTSLGSDSTWSTSRGQLQHPEVLPALSQQIWNAMRILCCKMIKTVRAQSSYLQWTEKFGH
jgi:hypothetical protein